MELSITNRNGQKLFHQYKPNSPLYVSVLIPNYSYVEPIKQRGITHIYEHFLCRENSFFNDLDLLKKEIAKRGIFVNAHTSLDCIKVHLGVPDRADFGWGLELLNAMFNTPSLRTEALSIEVGAIKNEIKDLQSNPSRYVYSKLYQTSLALGGDNIPNFGSLKDLSKISIKQLKSFHRHILEQPRTVISSGGIENLGDFIVNSHPDNKMPITKPQKAKVATIKLKSTDSDTMLGMCYPVLSGALNQVCALDILAEYLGHHSFGLLTDELRYKRGYIYGIEVGFNYYNKVSFFTICTNVSNSDLKKVEELIRENISDIINGKLKKESVDIVKKLIIKNSVPNIERTSGFVIANERLLKNYSNWKSDYSLYLENIRKITKEDLIEVAKLTFGR